MPVPPCPAHLKFRILHVLESLDRAGLERVASDLALSQHAAGHAVSVFCINDTDGFRAELEQAGIDVVIGGKSRSFDTRVMRRLRGVVAQADIDVVHTHNFMPNIYAAASLVGAMHERVQVTTCHDMGTRLSNRKLLAMYRLSLLRTDRVAMVGKQVHDRYVGQGLVKERRASTILNGIPVGKFAGASGSIVRAQLGIPASARVIGCVGRLVSIKNHALMIELMPDLVAKFPDLHLVLVGQGDSLDALQREVTSLGISGCVHIAGEQPDVVQWLAAFDIFALPSFSEGLSIALLEACASPLPTVAFAVGGNGEIIEHAVSGWLAGEGDKAAFRSGLERLIDDAGQRARFATAAANWVAANASVAAMTRQYDAFYVAALAEAGVNRRPLSPA